MHRYKLGAQLAEGPINLELFGGASGHSFLRRLKLKVRLDSGLSLLYLGLYLPTNSVCFVAKPVFDRYIFSSELFDSPINTLFSETKVLKSWKRFSGQLSLSRGAESTRDFDSEKNVGQYFGANVSFRASNCYWSLEASRNRGGKKKERGARKYGSVRVAQTFAG